MRVPLPYSMNKFGTLLVGLACFAGTAVAQNQPVAAPAPTPAADPAKVALAHEVIKAMQADRMLEGMTNQIKQMVAQQTAMYVTATASDEQKAKVALVQSQADALAGAAVQRVVASMDAVYAELFTEAELQGIKTFFLSPEGQSMLAKQPQLMQRLTPVVQRMQGELMPKIGELVQNLQKDLAPPRPAPVSVTTPPIEVPPAPAPTK